MNYVGLDLSTKTGFVRLTPDGEVLAKEEICYPCDTPESMFEMMKQVIQRIDASNDQVAIEDFGFGSQRGFQLGGIGWLIRCGLWRKGIPFYLVAPTALKKFTGAAGNAKKETIAVEVYKRWGFQDRSNNITDAYVLAQIARYQHEPVERIKSQDEVLKKINK